MTAAQFLDLAFGNLIRFFREAAFRQKARGPVSWGFVGTLLLVLCYGCLL